MCEEHVYIYDSSVETPILEIALPYIVEIISEYSYMKRSHWSERTFFSETIYEGDRGSVFEGWLKKVLTTLKNSAEY
jgi:hypothetical protein